MSYPLDLLLEYLKQLDETQLCELLEVSSEDIIEAFRDRIIDKRKFLEQEIEVFSTVEDEDYSEKDYE